MIHIHGARRAGRHRRKACMGCGVQGRGHIARHPAQLVNCGTVLCVIQDLQKQKESKEVELLDLQKNVNDKKSKVNIFTSLVLCTQHF